MRKVLLNIQQKIDQINEIIGKGVAWLNTVLVLLIMYDVITRYLFNVTSVGIIELEWHLFSLIFLLGAAFALKHDRHVRVDVFYANFTSRRQAWVNLLGTLIFLIPFCVIVIITSSKFAFNAFEIHEGSPDPGGLPARFIVKSAIPVGFALLLLQGVSLLIQSLLTLTAPAKNG